MKGDPLDLYGVLVTGTGTSGSWVPASPPTQTALDLRITVYPSAAPIGGIARVSVPNGGVSDDGRSLEFNIRFIGPPSPDYLKRLTVQACAPTGENDSPKFTADCIDGPEGFDAPYVGSILAMNWPPPEAKSTPIAVSLLLDQGHSVVVNDPGDQRLFAAKYLQTRLDPSDQVVVAAFASDDPVSGQPALLPSKPVTIYPVENPRFTTNGQGYFSTIDSLASLEGGASPLCASIDRVIDFTVANAPVDARRAVVALSSGHDDSCSSRDACWATQKALIDKSAAAGLAIVVVGLGDPSGKIDTKALSMFAQGENGAVYWANDARQIPTILGALPAMLDGGPGGYTPMDVIIRLESPIAGAFASGRVVSGITHVVACPWDCDVEFDIPFAVRIP